jgi:transcriptional regulator
VLAPCSPHRAGDDVFHDFAVSEIVPGTPRSNPSELESQISTTSLIRASWPADSTESGFRLADAERGGRLTPTIALRYILVRYMALTPPADAALKKGTAELLVLAQLEDRPRHGYEIARRIEARSGGAVSFNVASLYPVLYRLESRGLIAGRWVEKAGQRRRRYYRLTASGRTKLATQRDSWDAFMVGIQRAVGLDYA